jgi:hypothetical protein
MEYIYLEIYTLYTGTAGMLIHINGKFTIETKQEIIKDILKFYSMEQEITHYSRGKLHVDQITVRESARSTFSRGSKDRGKITLSRFNNYGY